MNSLLKMAVMAGITSVINVHIRRGADLNARDEKGMSLLMHAAAKGHDGICRLLLEAGADPLIVNKAGMNAFELASKNKRFEAQAILSTYLEKLQQHAEPEASLPDEESFYFFEWEEEVEPSLPVNDPTCFSDAKKCQNFISSHIPMDNAEDWSDIEIDLPETTFLLRKTREYDPFLAWHNRYGAENEEDTLLPEYLTYSDMVDIDLPKRLLDRHEQKEFEYHDAGDNPLVIAEDLDDGYDNFLELGRFSDDLEIEEYNLERAEEKEADYNSDWTPHYTGEKLYSCGKYTEAIKQFTVSISRFPYFANSFYFRGMSYYHLGKYEDAIRDFDNAIQYDYCDDESSLFYYRGLSCYILNRLESSIEDFDEVLKWCPDHKCKSIREIVSTKLAIIKTGVD